MPQTYTKEFGHYQTFYAGAKKLMEWTYYEIVAVITTITTISYLFN
jgi:hypothetical protein